MHAAPNLDDRPGSDPVPFSLATLEAIESDIVGVAAAIEALDDGTYGRCGFCGAEIEPDMLVAKPLAVRCRAHGSGPTEPPMPQPSSSPAPMR